MVSFVLVSRLVFSLRKSNIMVTKERQKEKRVPQRFQLSSTGQFSKILAVQIETSRRENIAQKVTTVIDVLCLYFYV